MTMLFLLCNLALVFAKKKKTPPPTLPPSTLSPTLVALKPGHFVEYPVKASQQSAAFLAVGDLDGNPDNGLEIILTTLLEQSPPGPPSAASRGALRKFNTAGCSALFNNCLAGPWEEEILIDTNSVPGYPFINQPQIMDVDEDGFNDIVVHTGFLTTLGGSHFWLKNRNLPAPLPTWTQQPFTLEGTLPFNNNFFWHESAQFDVDGDGLKDIVTTSAQTQSILNPLGSPDGNEGLKVEWYRQTESGQWTYHTIKAYTAEGDTVSLMGGVFIKAHDVDGDGDMDIVLSQFFRQADSNPDNMGDALIWLENVVAPKAGNNFEGIWHYHVIDQTIGLGYHMEFADIDGDGVKDLVVDSHNNQADPRWQTADGELAVPPGLYWFRVPESPRETASWQKNIISTDFRVTLAFTNPASQGVPGIFNVGDINDDGRNDVVVPGDGNEKLYAFLQEADGTWAEQIIDTGRMFGMAIIADLDGDGTNEIVAAQHNSMAGDPTNPSGLEDLTLPPGKLSIYKFVEDA